jgi:hypothetical protein
MVITRAVLAGLARFGYGTHGAVYVLIGAIAAEAAFDWRAEIIDARGALLTIVSQPAGEIALGVMILGLLSFSVWSLLQCIADTERIGFSPQALFVRAGFLGTSVGHVVLGFTALNLIFGWEPAGPNAEAEMKDWTSWAFARPWGRWVVGTLGAVVITGGIALLKNGWLGLFASRLVESRRVRRFAVPIGRVGVLAQGFVFTSTGCFLVTASLQADPEQARGMAGLLGTLRQQPYGWLLLAAVSLGLISYGIYGFIEAAFRKIKPPKALHKRQA